jgi:hypothetical protein
MSQAQEMVMEMSEEEAISLLHEMELISADDLEQMDHYLEMDAPMPPWMENQMQLIFLLQACPPTNSLH